MKLFVALERDESGWIVAECPSVPGCVSQGKTEEEALASIREAVQACLEVRAAEGLVFPAEHRDEAKSCVHEIARAGLLV